MRQLQSYGVFITLILMSSIGCKWLEPKAPDGVQAPPVVSLKAPERRADPELEPDEQAHQPLLPDDFSSFVNADGVAISDADAASVAASPDAFVPATQEECTDHPQWDWTGVLCQRRTIFTYCRTRDALGPEVTRTLSILVGRYGSCVEAANAISTAEELDLSKLGLSSLAPLFGLVKLRSLNISDNEIRDLSALSRADGLVELDISRNHISNLDPLRQMGKLAKVNLSYNPIEAFVPLRTMLTLRNVVAVSAAASDVAFIGNLINLTHLTLAANHITSATFLQPLKNLKYLDMSDNGLSEPGDFKDLANLEQLILDRNRFRSIEDFAQISQLRTLRLAHNQIDNLSTLTFLPLLEELDLSGNPLPRANLRGTFFQLFELRLDDTGITSVALIPAAAPQLRYLSIQGCQVTDYFPLAQLRFLETVDVSHCSKAFDVEQVFPDRVINVTR